MLAKELFCTNRCRPDLVDVRARGVHHDVAADVGRHALGHEDARALLLIVPVPAPPPITLCLG